ncbi:MAG: peptidoglycan DD-metalloendopeptidase family protein [Christensenellaceae bacterium]|jgi:murein DD-endopeptidase MepM/ murein hydrolase activator NlpD|nr:peptidoglycan DD-metalloendopeptidase family protein [Christensenellaceae bacterium]
MNNQETNLGQPQEQETSAPLPQPQQEASESAPEEAAIAGEASLAEQPVISEKAFAATEPSLPEQPVVSEEAPVAAEPSLPEPSVLNEETPAAEEAPLADQPVISEEDAAFCAELEAGIDQAAQAHEESMFEAEDALDAEDEYWDAYDDLYERPKKKSWNISFGAAVTTTFCLALLAAGIGGALKSGKGFLPATDESILSQRPGTAVEGPAAAPLAPEETAAQQPGEETGYMPTSIVIDGKIACTLYSYEAAIQLIEDVKQYFGDAALAAGAGGELAVELPQEVQLLPAPTVPAERLQLYDAMFAVFTGDNTPLKVQCTLTTSVSEAVGYHTEQEKDSNLLEGTRIIVRDGREGAKTTITQSVYINGRKSTSRGSTQTQVVEAQDRLERIGTQKIKETAVPGKSEGKRGPKTEQVFTAPVQAGIAGYFGQRAGVLHLGLDYATAENADVLASAAGQVICVMHRGGYGLMVEISHGEGFVTRYAHLMESAVQLGEEVTAGQVIGRAGDGENAEAARLHFELRIEGEAYNPLYYLKG